MDNSFGHWLAGFIDGEGCFVAQITKQGQIQTFMTIGLRSDDRAILDECCERTGLGSVYDKHSPSLQRWPAQAKWVIYRKRECQALVDLLHIYPLRAKKARDFAVWTQIVQAHAMRKIGSDTSEIRSLMTQLRETRTY